MSSRLLKMFLFLLLFNFSPLSIAATVYFAEIDSSQSSGQIYFLDLDETKTFQISGTIKITTGNGSIQFENINIESTPPYNLNEMILSNIGSYDGLNFDYLFCDTCIGNGYFGTFDTNTLYLSGVTYGQNLYDYTIISSNITSVPLPSGLVLFSSAIVGLLLQFRTKTSKQISNAAV
jgi:hypothetical protein